MSLINDALKKAQKQRTGDAPDLSKLPAIGGEPAARIARRDKPPAFNSMVLWIGVGATTVLILTVGAFFLIRWMMKNPEAPATAKAPVVAQSMPTAKETPTPTATPSAAKPPPSVATVQPSVPEVVVETKPVAVASTEAPAPVEAPKPVVAAVAPKMAAKAVAYIDALRVAGVRASGAESKVLMNDRVYRIGDTVEHVLGLKLAGITVDSLTFEDENGARYTRNL
jgi:cytoskeletal protein RodZ